MLLSSWLENPMDTGAWGAAGHGVTDSDMTDEHIQAHTQKLIHLNTIRYVILKIKVCREQIMLALLDEFSSNFNIHRNSSFLVKMQSLTQ